MDIRPIAIIDTETTGLDPQTHQVLEFACILWNPLTGERIGAFERVLQYGVLLGHPKAMYMNARLIKIISEYPEMCIHTSQLIPEWLAWMRANGLPAEEDSITVCGKNAAAFDIPFLKPFLAGSGLKIKHRVLDVGSLYYNPAEDGGELPSLQKCLDRAGIPKTVVHTALDDCEVVLSLLNNYYF